jgi:hypothetical protein
LTTGAKSVSDVKVHALPRFAFPERRLLAQSPFRQLERKFTRPETVMPTLLRFLTAVGVIAGLFYGSMFVLANFFEPQQHEMTKSIRDVKVK